MQYGQKTLCVMACLYEYNKGDFDVDKINSFHEFLNHFSSPTPRKIILRGTCWGNALFTMVMGKKVTGLRPMSTSLVTMNTFVNRTRINRATQKSTIPTYIMRGRVTGMRHISTSPITINICSTIDKVRVDGILRPQSTSSTITTLITRTIKFKITRGILDGLLIPKSTSSVTHRSFKTVIIRNTIVIMMVREKMDGLLRPISKTSITSYTQPFIDNIPW